MQVADVLEPEQVAQVVVDGLAAEQFLILPHPEVLDYFQRKANDYDRWLRGMRRLQTQRRPLYGATRALTQSAQLCSGLQPRTVAGCEASA